MASARPPEMYGGVKRKMRKGTNSCYECRRRKIRCIFAPDRPKICTGCFVRGSPCIGQAYFPDTKTPLRVEKKPNLKERIRVLENAIMQQPESSAAAKLAAIQPRATESQSASSMPVTRATTKSSASSESVLTATCGFTGLINRAEPTVQDAALPLLSMLQDFGVHDLPASSEPQDERPDAEPSIWARLKTPKHGPVIIGLLSAMPSREESLDILANRSAWWVYWREGVGITLGEDEDTTLEKYAHRVMAEGHPASLGCLLVCFAMSKPSDKERFLPAVERYIVNNDEYAGSIEGLKCLYALSKCYNDNIQLGKTWLLCRRNVSLAILRGLPRRLTTSRSCRALWWDMVAADRYTSMLMGLPHAVDAGHFGLRPPSTIEDAEPTGPMANQHEYSARVGRFFMNHATIFLGEVVNATQVWNDSSVVAILALDERIEAAMSKAPEGWWDIEATKRCDNHAERRVRLFTQLVYFQIRTYLHLPLLLRSASNPRYEFSRNACIAAARSQLRNYFAQIDIDKAYTSNAKLTNFMAFFAAVIIIIASLGGGKGTVEKREARSRKMSDGQTRHDWELLQSTLTAFRNGAQLQDGDLCKQYYNALEVLALGRSSAENGSKPPPRIHKIILPGFGTISVTKDASDGQQKTSPAASEPQVPLPTEAPQHDTAYQLLLNERVYPEGSIDLANVPLTTNPSDFDFATCLDQDLSFDYSGLYMSGADLHYTLAPSAADTTGQEGFPNINRIAQNSGINSNTRLGPAFNENTTALGPEHWASATINVDPEIDQSWAWNPEAWMPQPQIFGVRMHDANIYGPKQR